MVVRGMPGRSAWFFVPKIFRGISFGRKMVEKKPMVSKCEAVGKK